jgi:hypothetical protein
MMIDQRNAGASVNTNLAYPVDRFTMGNSSDGVATAQQSSTAPGAFPNSVVLTTTTADASLSAAQYLGFVQHVEGLNVADLRWGTASAETVTLSFWTRSSLTGTFSGSLRNSAGDRSYVFTYTISAANTWEQKSITIAGDTSGTWLKTNGIGIRLWFSLGTGSTYTTGTSGSWVAANYLSYTGSTSVIGTLSANWYITGVQLEKGTVATSFDLRPYTTELQLCQRYYYRTQPASAAQIQGSGVAYSTTAARISVPFFVQMRDVPVALEQSGTAANYGILGSGGWITCSAVPAFASASTSSIGMTFTVASGLTSGGGAVVRSENSSGYIGWSAEL